MPREISPQAPQDTDLARTLPSWSSTLCVSDHSLPPPWSADPRAWTGCQFLRVNFLCCSSHRGKRSADRLLMRVLLFSPNPSPHLFARQRNAACILCFVTQEHTRSKVISCRRDLHLPQPCWALPEVLYVPRTGHGSWVSRCRYTHWASWCYHPRQSVVSPADYFQV